jgi:hypothetical protein
MRKSWSLNELTETYTRKLHDHFCERAKGALPDDVSTRIRIAMKFAESAQEQFGLTCTQTRELEARIYERTSFMPLEQAL